MTDVVSVVGEKIVLQVRRLLVFCESVVTIEVMRSAVGKVASSHQRWKGVCRDRVAATMHVLASNS